jgi:hypothetical protein
MTSLDASKQNKLILWSFIKHDVAILMAKHAGLSLGIILSTCGPRNLIFIASSTVLLS